MGYDKKLLAEARRELERERASRSEAFEERRREVYAREPRIRAIDRTCRRRRQQFEGGAEHRRRPGRRDRGAAAAESACRLSVPVCCPAWGCRADYLTEKPM